MKLKKILMGLLLAVIVFLPAFANVKAEGNKVTVHVFKGKTCHYCQGFLTWANSLSDSEKEKFSVVAQGLKKLGILMAGLDVVDEKIIEINVTSPCYFIKEINERFSTRIDHKINEFLLLENSRVKICK